MKRRWNMWGWGSLVVGGLVLAGLSFKWSDDELAAARKAEAEMGWTEPVTLDAAEARIETDPLNEEAAIEVTDEAGRPLPGVRLFSSYPDAAPSQVVGFGEFSVSDARGRAQASSQPVVIGLAPDGRVAVNTGIKTFYQYGYENDGRTLDAESRRYPKNRLVFGRTDRLTIRLTDSRGRPVASRKISLFPAAEGGRLRGWGTVRMAPSYEKGIAEKLAAVTDAEGEARFDRLPEHGAFSVLVAEGEKSVFRPEGTVRPGQTVALTLPEGREISGRVVHAISEKPLSGMKVALRISSTARSWSSPETIFRTATTDAEGRYGFDGLPAGPYYVEILELESGFGKRAYVESRLGSGPWVERGWLAWPKPDGAVRRETHNGTLVRPGKESTKLDFRMFDFARLEITTDGPRGIDLALSDALLGEGSGGGRDFHNAKHWYEEERSVFLLRPGRHRLRLYAFASRESLDLGTVTVREGENRRMAIEIPKRPPFAPLPPGAEIQQNGGGVFDFRVLGSDGRRYDSETLVKGGPVLLFNLTEQGFPLAVSQLNRLHTMLRGKIRVAGYVFEDAAEMRKLVRRHKIRFLLLGPPEADGIADEIPQMLSDDRTRTYLANGLLLPNGSLTHVWCGFNRYTLKQMALDYERNLGRPLGVDFSGFSKKIVVGSGSMYGLPGP